MVRTRDTAGTKAVGAKAPRKVTGSTSSAGASASASLSDSAKNKYSGGNPYFPRETPAWQKPITAFFASGQGECSQKENNSGQVNVDCNTTNNTGVEPTNGKQACEQIGDNATDGEEIKEMDGIVKVCAVGGMEKEMGSQNSDNAIDTEHGLTIDSPRITIEKEPCSSGDDKMTECGQMDA